MEKLSNNELLDIRGGAISGTLISSIVRGIGVIVDIGRAIGTAIRRLNENKMCSV